MKTATVPPIKLGQVSHSGRIRLPPVLAGLAVFFAGFVAATQYVAQALGYQAALGPALFEAGGLKLYSPINWMRWYVQFHKITSVELDAIFRTSAYVVMGFMLAAVIVAVIYRHILTRDLQVASPDLHGSAAFMTPQEVAESGLVGQGAGVYVGAYLHPKTGVTQYLRHDGPEHILCTAPTRSGKGVGLCVPTLLSWPHSAVVYDKKKELWALTSGWRQREANNRVVFIDPTDSTGASAKFNPLNEIPVGTPDEVGAVQNIAQSIVDPDGKGMADHWAKTGHELLSAGILHVLYAERNKTLRGLVSFFCDPTSTMEQVAETMIHTEHDPEGKYGWVDPISGEPTKTHPMIAEAARSFLNKSENERSGVQSTAMSFLTIYRDPIIAANTASSDFKVEDLMLHDKPVTLYIVDDPKHSDRIRPFIRLLVSQIVQGNLRTLKFEGGRPVPTYKHRMLLLFDEFPALGKLEIFQTQLAFIAGFGMKAYLIIQDKAQLDDKYGDKEQITSNCHIRNYYAPNKIETAKNISDMLGTSTRIKEKVSYSGKRSRSTLDQISVSLEEVSRPLMTPDEVMRLRGPLKEGSQGLIVRAGEMLVQAAGQKPIRGEQPLYFRDPTFNERAQIESPKESERLRDAAPEIAALPRPILLAAEEPPFDVDEAYGESPPLDDSALADYGDDPMEGDAIEPPAEALVIDDSEEIAFGTEYQVTAAELDDVETGEDDEDQEGDAASAEAASTKDPYLDALHAFAAGMPAEDEMVERQAEQPVAPPAPKPVAAATALSDPYAIFDELNQLAEEEGYQLKAPVA
jgi:type IV secretion system protein VirD4